MGTRTRMSVFRNKQEIVCGRSQRIGLEEISSPIKMVPQPRVELGTY